MTAKGSTRNKKDAMSDQLTNIYNQLTNLTSEVAANGAKMDAVVQRLDTLNGKVAKLQEQANGHEKWIAAKEESCAFKDCAFVESKQELIQKIEAIHTQADNTDERINKVLQIDLRVVAKYAVYVVLALLAFYAGRFELLGKILALLG